MSIHLRRANVRLFLSISLCATEIIDNIALMSFYPVYRLLYHVPSKLYDLSMKSEFSHKVKSGPLSVQQQNAITMAFC